MDREWIDQLLSKADIVRVIGRYLPLKKQGSNHWGNCPFHHEKTPSFSVNESKQYYHCFGCKESGSAISFLMKIESISFWDAVKILAEQVGFELPKLEFNKADKQKYEYRNVLYDILRESAVFYRHNLNSNEGQKAQSYLSNRGVDKELSAKFGIGVSLNSYGLYNHLIDKGYKLEDMVAAGVIAINNNNGSVVNSDYVDDKNSTSSSDNTDVNNGINNNNNQVSVITTKKGNNYDVFYNRLIVPIINHLDKVVGFGARDLSGGNSAKYKNSWQNEIFDKSSVLFASNLIKKLKQQQRVEYLLLVEGYMDVIALHSVGIFNCVASMGTALTIKQARLIKNYCACVYVSYDGDTAGQKATMRSLDTLEQAGLSVRVVVLPNGLDPDEYIKKHGVDEYKNLVDNAYTPTAYKINSLYSDDIVTDQSKKMEFATNSVSIIAHLDNEIAKEEYLKLVAKLSGYSIEVLNKQLQQVYNNVQDNANEPQLATQLAIDKDGKQLVGRDDVDFVLASVINKKPYVDLTIDIALWLKNPNDRQLYQYAIDCFKHDKNFHLDYFLQEDTIGDDYKNLILYYQSDFEFKDGDNDKKFNKAILNMQINALKDRINDIKSQSSQSIEEIKEVLELSKKIKELEKESKTLN